jgi:hypothetical protein
MRHERMSWVLVLPFSLLWSGVVRGQGDAPAGADMSKVIDDLEKRLADQEKRLADQEAQILELKAKQGALTPQGADREASKAEPSKGDAAKGGAPAGSAPSPAPPKGQSVWSSVGIQLYGYIKADAALDSSRVDNGNFARWVLSEETNENDYQFNMTARQSRLGAKFTGPQLETVKTSAQFEMDFYGGGDENKNTPMMRHAFLTIDWTAADLALLAGQTFDLISPLYPDTLNYTVGWWVGNIGYRRPQVRLTKGFNIDGSARLEMAAAASRTIGHTDSFSPGDTGEDAGFPTAQGRVALTFPSFGVRPATMGVSGHWGLEEYDTNASGDNEKFQSWSLNLDYSQPFTQWLALKLEAFTGENLDMYLGGIGQGLDFPVAGDATQADEIDSSGGWAAANIGPFDKFTFLLGYSIDTVRSTDVSVGSRTKNQSIFGNVVYQVVENTSIGLEVSYWRTNYRKQEEGDAIRGQMAFIFKF